MPLGLFVTGAAMWWKKRCRRALRPAAGVSEPMLVQIAGEPAQRAEPSVR
jgi:hypothetical protein